MSVSVYYSLSRATSLTAEEISALQTIIDEGNQNIPGDGSALDLFTDNSPSRIDPELRASGSAQLGLEEEHWEEALFHWCQVISRLRRAVPDASWHVHMDDFDIPWSDETGYRPDLG